MMSFVAIAAGLALLYAGAEALVRGSARLALRLGLSPLVVGLTVVAFGTSSPELVVSVQAALAGRGAIAVGNVVGSNICNIALILGLTAVIRPLAVQAQLIRVDIPVMIGCSGLLALLLVDQRLARVEGALLAAGIVAYTVFTIRQARKEAPAVQEEFLQALPPPRTGLGRDILFIAGGLLLLVLGAGFLVDGAVAVAARLGVSQAVIGLTIVAAGTSLPELATSAIAASKNEADLAVGNIIGSNVFNILAILGVSAAIRPLQSEGIQAADLALMNALAILTLPLMRSGFRLTRAEGAFLLAVYAGYLYYLLS